MTIDDDGSEAQDPGFRHIGEIIAAQKAKIEQALVACDEPAAAEAHEDLIRAEHEQRVIETVRRCAAKVARLQNSGNGYKTTELSAPTLILGLIRPLSKRDKRNDC